MAGLTPEAFGSVKLKPTSIAKDRSAPNYTLALQGEVSKEKEEERRDYFFSTGLDRWYESLKDETFKTVFLAMTPSEAGAIVRYWEAHFKDRTSEDHRNPIEITLPVELAILCNRIDCAIKTLSPSGEGAFIKLSTRSPKDSHVAFMKACDYYHKKVTPSLSLNDRLILLQEAVINSLNVKTGQEALQLLVSSTRVGEDLGYALEPGDEGFQDRSSLVLREWVDIPLWAEFRGFVWEGSLTSIGQYNHPVVFQELASKMEIIKSDLEHFYDNIKSKIPQVSRYIIDFAWTPDKVYLVEINPFDGEIVFPASTGLWDWEKDRQQMTSGPLELRIRTIEQDPSVLKNSTDPLWRTVLCE